MAIDYANTLTAEESAIECTCVKTSDNMVSMNNGGNQRTGRRDALLDAHDRNVVEALA